MEARKFSADAQLASRLDPVIDGAIGRAQIVGAVMLVARRGTVVYQRAAVGMLGEFPDATVAHSTRPSLIDRARIDRSHL